MAKKRFITMTDAEWLTDKEKMAIINFEELLLERFPKRFRKLFLFGSKSRGDFKKASDLDLLVVVSKNSRKVRKEVASLTHEPIADLGVYLSPIVSEEKEFESWSPFIENVKREGILLWRNRI